MFVLSKKEFWLLGIVIAAMAIYFVLAQPQMNDDGFHYEGFAEALSRGDLDFKSFYGFQGLSIFAVPVYWLTGSHDSIIVASAIFSLLSIILAYAIGKVLYGSRRAGIYFLMLFLLMPYPYTTMMRGFQEAALLFFVLLTIYASIAKKHWTPAVWAIGGIVKPFALTLFPLFFKNTFSKKNLIWLAVGLAIGGLYLGASYYQTGHLVNNAAINSYQGNFDPANPPALTESFTFGPKGFLRAAANLLVHSRKIMVSPLAVVIGGLALLFRSTLPFRKEFLLAIIINVVLVGLLTFSFSKYLLPAAVLLALASVPILLRYPLLAALVILDSIFVFMPIWNYFGHVYWASLYVYLIPLWLAVALFIYDRFFTRDSSYPHAK